MRAIEMTEFGGPEVLKLAEVPAPEPGPDEVLIKVTRAGLNFADTHTRTNSYVQKATLPLIPGGEVAGIREDTGERVMALVGSGGYAEYAVAPEELVFPIPADVDDGAALAMIVQGTTAWHLYRTPGGRWVARRPARPSSGRRTGDRDRLERGEARPRAQARRRRGDRPRTGGAHRATGRGQPRPAGGCGVRHGRRGGVRRLL